MGSASSSTPSTMSSLSKLDTGSEVPHLEKSMSPASMHTSSFSASSTTSFHTTVPTGTLMLISSPRFPCVPCAAPLPPLPAAILKGKSPSPFTCREASIHTSPPLPPLPPSAPLLRFAPPSFMKLTAPDPPLPAVMTTRRRSTKALSFLSSSAVFSTPQTSVAASVRVDVHEASPRKVVGYRTIGTHLRTTSRRHAIHLERALLPAAGAHQVFGGVGTD